MRTLAKKYAISDVGLSKLCRNLSILLPGRGYWAKRKAGQDVKRTPLLALKKEIILVKAPPHPQLPTLTEIARQAELTQIETLEQTDGEMLMKRGNLSHPLIAQTNLALRDADVNERTLLRSRKPSLDIKISNDHLDRALRIMASLISAVEAAGFSVSVDAGDRHETVANIYHQKLKFGLVEMTRRGMITMPPKDGSAESTPWNRGTPIMFEPTGKFFVAVWNAWGSGQKRWSDGKLQHLETQLSRIAAGFMRIALVHRAEHEKRETELRVQKRREEEHAQQRALIKAEQSKVHALRHAAAEWACAERIRSFIAAARNAAVQNGQSNEAGTSFGDWITWAEWQADRADPLKDGLPSLLDDSSNMNPAYPSNLSNRYQEAPSPFRSPKPIWRMK